MTAKEPHSPVRILLVDDHPLVRDGIASRLDDESWIDIVAQANNGEEALSLAHALNPDVVLMDVAMPVMDGLEAARRFQAELPDCRVLILSMHDDREYISELMQLGAAGYVLKDVESDELIKAIETVHHGSTYFSAGASQSLFTRAQGNPTPPHDALTQREKTVLCRVAEGACNKDIARALDISVRTVETHRQNIKNKLDIYTTAGLTRYAIESGLVKLS
ncbi:MAG TPA: DNA-binding response regulator [Gammaproteobacteria bacterium]|jgi:two-component system nitrate/nitrite response regulator NarL|nr:DNA-binding response regulator [Gammaproteobacteria bacterium]